MTLLDEVECEEAAVSAGHKGQPSVGQKQGRKGRCRRLKGQGGRGTWAKERPPVFGLSQRGGQVVLKLRAKGQQKTIEPFLKDTLVPGTLGYTEEYSLYVRLPSWGYGHKQVNQGRGEFARDEAGDGFCEGQVNPREGFWSRLRRGRRPHRGIAQEKLPFSLGFLACVHHVRKRGTAWLGALIELLVS